MESASYKLQTVFQEDECRCGRFMLLKSPCIPIPSMKYQTEGNSKQKIIKILKKSSKFDFFQIQKIFF